LQPTTGGEEGHATDHDRGWHPRLHTQANFGGEKTRMWNAIARPVENGNRAHKMEWPGPRTYLDDVPLQLRLLSSFLRAPNRISGLGRCSFRVDAAGVGCQNISKHATLVRLGYGPRRWALQGLRGSVI
jgi:hypothetical protein